MGIAVIVVQVITVAKRTNLIYTYLLKDALALGWPARVDLSFLGLLNYMV
jgi:Na+-transporting NADH:ubiquinone oxidoreductase subunit NqrE